MTCGKNKFSNNYFHPVRGSPVFTLIVSSKGDTSITGLCPEMYEVLERGEGHKNAVKKTIKEKQNKELVVIKRHTVVDPRTVMIHFKYASATHRTVVRPVGLYVGTFLTIPHGALHK